MPCLACADRLLRLFLRDIVALNVRYSAPVALRTPQTLQWRWFSARRQATRQSCHSSVRSPVAASNTPAIDLYVPFDEVLTAGKIPPLPRHASQLKKRGTSHHQTSPSPYVSRGRTRTFLQNDTDHVGLDFEPSIMLLQDAGIGGDCLARALKGSPEASNAPDCRPTSSTEAPPEKFCYESAFAELSPDAIDAISAEAVMSESMYMVLPNGGDESESAVHSRTLEGMAQSGGQVNSGVATATAPNRIGSRVTPRVRHNAEPWQVQKDALEAKFGSRGWNPRKRLSPDALDGIRALNAQFPDKYTTPVLAEQFQVSPEAIRRVLKSKWRPSDEEAEQRRERWYKRGEKIWGKMVELGVKPPKKWREMGVGKRKIGDLRPGKPGRQGLSERRKLRSADNGGREEVSHDDWDEVTLAERIL